MKIDNFFITKTGSVFISAELSANHNGSLQTAIENIKAAKRAGANCIKLQIYPADTMTIDANTDDFLLKQGTILDGQDLYDFYKQAYTPYEWHKELFKVAKEEGSICFSTFFDTSAIDLLEILVKTSLKDKFKGERLSHQDIK